MNDKLLEEILSELKSLNHRVTNMENNMITKMEFKEVLSDIQDVKDDLATLATQQKDDVVEVLQKLDKIEQRIDIGLDDLSAGQNVLAEKLFQHDKDLRLIKKVK